MIKTVFSISNISDVTTLEYIKCLNIYNSTTPFEIKTNSNEITYWLSHENSHFKCFAFSLYLNNQHVGFALTTYIHNFKVLIYDYIAIEEKYRTNAVFLSFFSLLKTYFSDESKLDVNYYFVEINNKNFGKDMDRESVIFLKFLCIEDFVRVNHEYRTLPLGMDNKESEFNTYAYIKTVDNRKQISSETFLQIIDSIYMEYYVEWYQPFMDVETHNNYTTYAHENLDILKNEIKKKKQISLIGMSCSCEKTSTAGNLPYIKKSKIWIRILLALALLAVPIGIIWCYNIILSKIGIPITNVNSAIGGMVGAIIPVIIAIFISNKN